MGVVARDHFGLSFPTSFMRSLVWRNQAELPLGVVMNRDEVGISPYWEMPSHIALDVACPFPESFVQLKSRPGFDCDALGNVDEFVQCCSVTNRNQALLETVSRSTVDPLSDAPMFDSPSIGLGALAAALGFDQTILNMRLVKFVRRVRF